MELIAVEMMDVEAFRKVAVHRVVAEYLCCPVHRPAVFVPVSLSAARLEAAVSFGVDMTTAHRLKVTGGLILISPNIPRMRANQ